MRILAETYLDLLKDKNHWLFEWTVEIVSSIPAFFIGKVLVRRHDQKHHAKEVPNIIDDGEAMPRSIDSQCPFCDSTFVFVNDEEQTMWCTVCRRSSNLHEIGKILSMRRHPAFRGFDDVL